jgi:spermidine/putrescine transport system ATP-binding protein
MEDRAPPLVRIDRVSKRFGEGSGAVTALDEVSVDLDSNEFFTLLGPSGCGKTTLLRLIAGFEHPSAGSILLDGRDLTGDPPNRRPVNTVFQSYALFPHMSVARNVGFGLERQGKDPTLSAGRVAEMLALVQMSGMAKRLPGQLSGGQQQRVALARALAPGPRLLLLDEPLSALDLKLRRGMQTELKRLQRETGITFVLVTHDQEEALSMSDRIAVMQAGRIVQLGTPADIYERPRTRFVADFIGEANVLPGGMVGSAAHFVAIRPERVALTTDPDAAGALAGVIADVTYLGADTVCEVTLADGTSIKAVLRDRPASLAPGAATFCILPPESLLELEA